MEKKSAAVTGILISISIFFFTAVSFSSAGNSEKNFLPVFYGVWEGMGSQDTNSTWSIRLTIGRAKFSVEYPSLKCGGELSLIEQGDNSMRFSEKITEGRQSCVDGGTIVIRGTAPDQLKYEWYYPNGGLGAVGLLKRVKTE